ncbi:MAG: hypothetical protein ABSC53_03775 [Bacteroidota bacterium]
MTNTPTQNETPSVDPQLQTATENLKQPFKFVATVLFVYLPRMPKGVQGVVVVAFTAIIFLLCVGALKQFGGIDLLALFSKQSYDYQVSGELVNRNDFRWPPTSSGIEFSSTKMLFTHKEIMQGGFFRLIWIVKFPQNDLGSGAIDLSVTEREPAGGYKEIASTLKNYSSLFDPSKPYRWVRLIIDSTNASDKIKIEFID